MNLESIRDYLDQHPEGVLVRMIDGTEYRVPHRDYASFGPLGESKVTPRGRNATSFIVYDVNNDLRMKLVNALLVKEVVPMQGKGGSSGRRGRRKAG